MLSIEQISDQTASEAFQNRVKLMAGIFKHQGDTAFYRRMLDNNAGLFSQIASVTGESCKVTHDDILAYCGVAQLKPKQVEEVEEVEDEHEFF